MAGLGVVIRNSYSKIITGSSQRTQFGGDVKYAEVEGIV